MRCIVMSSGTTFVLPSPAVFDPTEFFGSMFSYPWWTVARHFTALTFYGLAFAQFPNNGLRRFEVHHAYDLSMATFTLVFWCACFFHYAITAGRVDVDWTNGRFRARGWIVRSSRRTHRIVLVLSLAIAAATVVQTSTLHSIMNAEYKAKSPVDKDLDFTGFNLLKADFVFSLILSIYFGVRLSLEPTALLKRRREPILRQGHAPMTPGSTTTNTDGQSFAGRSEEDLKTSEIPLRRIQCAPPDFAEECQICIQRMANRQLNCGHLICCCCVMDLIKYSTVPPSALTCPFCRQPINCARELRLVISDTPIPLTQCCTNREDIF